MDDEQRMRMRDLKRLTRWEMLTAGAILAAAIAVGAFLFDDWTRFLATGSMALAVATLIFVSNWRYIRRGPFPRLPASMRERERPRE